MNSLLLLFLFSSTLFFYYLFYMFLLLVIKLLKLLDNTCYFCDSPAIKLYVLPMLLSPLYASHIEVSRLKIPRVLVHFRESSIYHCFIHKTAAFIWGWVLFTIFSFKLPLLFAGGFYSRQYGNHLTFPSAIFGNSVKKYRTTFFASSV